MNRVDWKRAVRDLLERLPDDVDLDDILCAIFALGAEAGHPRFFTHEFDDTGDDDLIA